MLESRTPAQPSLGEAITALRRGEPVLIRDDEINVLAVAAELATEENLQRLREISQAPARVVLTRRRAVPTTARPRPAPRHSLLFAAGFWAFLRSAAGRSRDGINLIGARCLPVTRYRNCLRMLRARR